MLKIYNTLARDKQAFLPIVPGQVRMYVCGMTVYDYCHIGHARVHDRVRRRAALAAARGYRVTYVRNITDIDDKIIRRAARERRPIERAHRRASSPRCTRTPTRSASSGPTHEPRATEYVPQMIDMIADARATRASRTGRQRRRELRGPPLPRLRQALGQVARRAARRRARRGRLTARTTRSTSCCGSKPKPGEPQWRLAVGQGPPGLAHRVLGDVAARCSATHFDIHGGGRTCSSRITRTRSRRPKARAARRSSTTGCTTASCNVDNEKMSKSLGNFFTDPRRARALRRRSRALLHRARALPQPAELFRPAPRGCEARR